MDEDAARVELECQACGARGPSSAELGHKADCKPRVGGVRKVCSKSGKAPHATETRK